MAGRMVATRRRKGVPTIARLVEGLSVALMPGSGHGEAPLVIGRKDEATQSSFPCEIVVCEYQGRRLQLFCKYSGTSADPAWHGAYGHRHGVVFEADVYERVLSPLKVSVPALRGIYRSESRKETWLVLEYLSGAMKLHKTPEFMTAAASWIGRFHALSQRHLSGIDYSFLPRYSRAYYRGWSNRARRYTNRAGLGGRWLDDVMSRYEDDIDVLLTGPEAVIHGEFYPANVLVRRRRIRPVDWETAAVACCEIDIASLTEGWSARVARDCERAYSQARWPEGAPRSFKRRLQAARAYMLMRWAGEPSHWTDDESRAYYTSQLRTLGLP